MLAFYVRPDGVLVRMWQPRQPMERETVCRQVMMPVALVLPHAHHEDAVAEQAASRKCTSGF